MTGDLVRVRRNEFAGGQKKKKTLPNMANVAATDVPSFLPFHLAAIFEWESTTSHDNLEISCKVDNPFPGHAGEVEAARGVQKILVFIHPVWSNDL